MFNEFWAKVGKIFWQYSKLGYYIEGLLLFADRSCCHVWRSKIGASSKMFLADYECDITVSLLSCIQVADMLCCKTAKVTTQKLTWFSISHYNRKLAFHAGANDANEERTLFACCSCVCRATLYVIRLVWVASVKNLKTIHIYATRRDVQLTWDHELCLLYRQHTNM